MSLYKALLVGINAYPTKPLRGCIKDVIQMKDLLTGHYEFSEENIRLIVDEAATMSAIKAGLEWLAQGDGQSDTVRVFHFSGHGSYVVDQNGDEPDGRDECLAPVDYITAGMLTDDTLKAIYDCFPSTGNLTLVMDSCHSGSVQKDLEQDIIGKFLPITPEEQERIDRAAARFGLERREYVLGEIQELRDQGLTDDELRAKVAELMQLFEKRRFGSMQVCDANVLLAGCRADQQSADAYIAEGYHGAFTYYLVEAIIKANGHIMYRDLARRAADMLYANGFLQVPQLECRGGRDECLAFRSFL